MQVALTLDFRNAPERRRPWREFWEDNLWLLCEAEAMGFDSVLVQEHFFTEDGYAPSMPIFLALLAERTQKIRIGAYLYILPLHNPMQIAQETAVLDHLSGGRLDVTVGIGHRVAEYRAFGLDPRHRPSRMEEALEILRLAWSGKPFRFLGKHFEIGQGDAPAVEIQPPPLQTPHPPLWVGATSSAAAARAGRHGLHLHGASVDPSVYDTYRQSLTDAGHDPSRFRVSNPLSITTTHENPEAVWARNSDHYHYRWDFYRKIRQEIGDPDLDYELAPRTDAYRENELIGDPQTVLETVLPLVDRLGLTDLVVFGPASGIDPRREGYESLRLFADEVLPVLKER
ncbi:LLM class flavin-dependent oxidoreductase [Myxococcota bacterium]|nr:LLM class flavin-dependent oxidoreductase [Myxococcota bacterium]